MAYKMLGCLTSCLCPAPLVSRILLEATSAWSNPTWTSVSFASSPSEALTILPHAYLHTLFHFFHSTYLLKILLSIIMKA